MNKPNLEKDILQYGLMVGIGYQLYQTFISAIPELQPTMAVINIFITLSLFYIFLIVQRKGPHPLLLLTIHVLTLSGFIFFWKNFGGMAGTVPSFLCVYSAFIIICSHGILRWVLITMLLSVVFVFLRFPEWLGMTNIHEPHKIGIVQVGIDYTVVAVLLMLLLLYMKKKFIYYRDGVADRYKQNDQIAKTLHHQNQELATRQEETRAINENLEFLVDQRIGEAENKNKELSEYAFINAHMLRGPLCRIIGLINLMEKEPHLYPPEQIAPLKAIAQEIDQHVKEINSALI